MRCRPGDRLLELDGATRVWFPELHEKAWQIEAQERRQRQNKQLVHRKALDLDVDSDEGLSPCSLGSSDGNPI